MTIAPQPGDVVISRRPVRTAICDLSRKGALVAANVMDAIGWWIWHLGGGRPAAAAALNRERFPRAPAKTAQACSWVTASRRIDKTA